MADNTFINFVDNNQEEIKTTLQDMSKHGMFYRSLRAMLTILQVLPPINFMSARRDVIFSDVLNDKFYGTSILCYQVKTYHWNNMWSVPIGAPNASRALLQSIPFYNIIWWYKVYEEQSLNYKLVQRGININSNGKIEVKGVPNVTIYRSERQSEVLSDDEQIAVCLYEVSKNCLLFDYLVKSRINKICLLLDSLLAGGIIVSGSGSIGANILGHSDISKDLAFPLVIAAILFTLVSAVAVYNNRKFVWDTDDLVKKMGYGDAMASALLKMDKYMSGGSFKLSGLNAPEQLLNIVDTILYQIEKVLSYMKINFTPFIKDRVDVLQQKPDIDSVKGPENIIVAKQLEYYQIFTDHLDQTMETVIKNMVQPTL